MDANSTRKIYDRLMQGGEAVTFRSRSSAAQSSFTSYALARAKKHRIQKDQAVMSSQEAVWGISRLTLDNATPSVAPAPKTGDQIQDSLGTMWVIEEVEIKFFGNVFNCKSFKQRGT